MRWATTSPPACPRRQGRPKDCAKNRDFRAVCSKESLSDSKGFAYQLVRLRKPLLMPMHTGQAIEIGHQAFVAEQF
jgi:hypothetical protein